MPAKKASISINLLADATKAKAGFAEAEKAADKFDVQLGNVAKTAINAFATREIANFGRAAINEASDLAESANAVDVAFGDAADRILQLGENASTAVGLSATDFNQFAVQFSGFAKQLTSDEQDIVAVTEEISTRVADFASVMNLEVPDAASKFQSALSGSAEVLRPYGIDVSDAAVKQQALADGIWDGVGNMTESEKVMGRYRAIMEQTSQMAGDFANTSDGLANQQRILKAEFDNIKATVGEAMIPALESLMSAVKPVLEAFTALPDGMQQVGVLGLAAVGGTKALSNTIQGLGGSAKFANKMAFGLTGTMVGLTIALDHFATKQREIDEAAQSMREVLDENNNVFDDTAQSMLQFNIAGTDLDRDLETIGLTVQDFTDALSGNQDAINKVSEAAEHYTEIGDGFWNIFKTTRVATEEQTVASKNVQRALEGHMQAMEDAAYEAERLAEMQKSLETNTGHAEAEMRRFNDIIFEGTSGMDNFAETTRGAVDIALDPLNEGIETATTRLDKLFGLLSDEDAVNKFTDDLSALGEELANTAEGTEEYDRLMNDALQTVETLRDQHSSLSDAFLEGLVFEVQTGDLEYALDLIGKVQDYLGQGFAPGFEGLEIPQSVADLQAGGYVPNGVASSVVINNNIEAGVVTDPAALGRTTVEAINEYYATGGEKIATPL